MSTKPKSGGPAFPTPMDFYGDGMTLRDWFAGQALAGYRCNRDYSEHSSSDIAMYSYMDADAMLAQREGAQ